MIQDHIDILPQKIVRIIPFFDDGTYLFTLDDLKIEFMEFWQILLDCGHTEKYFLFDLRLGDCRTTVSWMQDIYIYENIKKSSAKSLRIYGYKFKNETSKKAYEFMRL